MKVITNPGCYEFEDGEMILTSLHPHCTLEQVRDRTGRAVRVYSRLETTAPPTPREPRILRDELDPARLYTGGLQVGT